MEVEAVINEISKLATLAEKLTFYNKHYSSLSQIDIHYHQVGFANCSESKNIFCLCSNCKDKYSLHDFETYRKLRNAETDRIISFFNDSNLDYSDKVEYYFKISIGFSKTSRKLYFVPEDINSMYDNEFQYRLSIIDITPRNESEQNILKACIKRELINHTSRVTISLNQFTFEYRRAIMEGYLPVRKDKTRRTRLIKSELKKIELLEIDKNSQKPYDIFNYQILQIVENIFQKKHVEAYTDFNDLKKTILAEDCIKYEQYLNNLSLPESERELTLSNQERNHIILNKYYNSIRNSRVFQEEILNSSSELHYIKRITSFIANRNIALQNNLLLKQKEEWLISFNRALKNFMAHFVTCYKHVVEWKNDNTKFHECTINIKLSNYVENFSGLAESLRLNNNNNNDLLVLKMREYYLDGIKSMIAFLKSELLIDFESSPYYSRFAIIIEDIKNAVDFESLKLSLSFQSQNIITVEIEKEDENVLQNLDENNFLISTIEDHLEQFQENINEGDYRTLVNALNLYFTVGNFPTIEKKITFKSVNKKRVGWALKEIYVNEKTEAISYEYLLFAKENINNFKDVNLSTENFKSSNLYKYFTTNPAK